MPPKGKEAADREPPENALIKNVQTLLKKLAPQLLKLIIGHDPGLYAFVEGLGKKNGLPPVLLLGNMLAVKAHLLAPGTLRPLANPPETPSREACPMRDAGVLSAAAAKTGYKKTDEFTLIVHGSLA